MRLPLVQKQKDDDAVLVEATQSTSGRRPRVLLVEDNADMRRFLRSALSPHFDMYVATDGAQGLAEAGRLLPDVVVTCVIERLAETLLTAIPPVM